MVEPASFTLSEALNRFVVAKKNGKKAVEGHQELWRFVAWCGRERRVGEISPAEVADYAQHMGQGGADSAQRLNPVKTFLTFLKDEGWVENSLAAHLRIPRNRKGGGRRSTHGQSESTHLSQEGYERLVTQLDVLKEERVKVVDDIKLAMADKDFRENAPLDAAKERQGIIEAKIRELEAGLANAQILENNQGSHHRVVVGSKISLKDISSGKQLVYTLVDVREADVAAGKISNVSPVGQALLDRTVGDEITINVPRGTLRYVIENIGH